MIAKTLFGLEHVLADELAALGAEQVRPGRRMCAFQGSTALLYQANLACRTAVRVLKPIHAFTAADEQQLYAGVQQIDWRTHLDVDDSLAIDPVVHSVEFNNSLYAAQLTKDAIVDQLRRGNRRPSVDLADPRLRINLHVDQQRVTIYLDASGDSLHKRGYRVETGEAPISEVLAAGILRLMGWDQRSPLADFMCGSGTFVIEAALWARRIAPGLVRQKFGYQRWKDFDRQEHDKIVAELRAQVRGPLDFPIQGSDLDGAVLEAARANARRAGVERDIRLLTENFESVRPPAERGTLITNPPYDERMRAPAIAAVYRRLGDVLKRNWAGYDAHVFTGNLDAAKQIGLRSTRRVRLFNGPIECRLIKLPITAVESHGEPARPARAPRDASNEFISRLSRMAKHWHRAARRQGISAYRMYDRDLPEVPLAIDWYAGHVLVSEYSRTHARTEIEQQAWLERMRELIAETLKVKPGDVHVAPARGSLAASSAGESADLTVKEGPLKFHVRLGVGKATGLALDRRLLRARWMKQATGLRCLSLFAGSGATGTALGAGGAASVLCVDASKPLLSLADRNAELNGLSSGTWSVRCQDPLEFVGEIEPHAPPFDLIVVEAPSFDGKRREGVWNIQDGHVELLNCLLPQLTPDGRLYLVTGFRRLTLRAAELQAASVHEITRQTVPPEFRDRKVHRAWMLAGRV